MNRLAIILVVITIVIMAVITGCFGSGDQIDINDISVKLTVAVAASLQEAMEELKSIYIRHHAGVTIKNNYASSGTLQKQIEEGAPVDLFISASLQQMDALAEKGLIIDASHHDLLRNELVLIAKKDSQIKGFNDLISKSVVKISIGVPETVPAGQYARESLITLGLWDQVQSKLVFAKDVRQVLTYVETGNVEAGLVYRSDALTGKGVKIVAVVPDNAHNQIVYPMAVIKGTKQQKAAEEFAAFLSSEEAARVFEKHGFKPVK